MSHASLWDLVSAWMHTDRRPQDFVWSLGHSEWPGDLEARFERACQLLPKTRSVIEGTRWVACERRPTLEQTQRTRAEAMSAALRAPLEPDRGPLLRLERTIDGAVFQAHHALCDLAGALCWLSALLSETVEVDEQLELKSHPTPRRKHRLAHLGPSRRLWTRGRPSGRRAFRSLARDELEPRVDDVTYNDRLALAWLEALADHQRRRDRSARRLALWLPVNVRTEPFRGLGNGTSRIRIYRHQIEGSKVAERRASFAAQRRVAKDAGEWFVPSTPPSTKLPLWVIRPLLLAYLQRPWVDMGSAPFSHAHRLGPPGRFAGLTPGALVMNLHAWHPVGLAGTTHTGRTHLTFTWDPEQLDEDDIDHLVTRFVHHLEAR